MPTSTNHKQAQFRVQTTHNAYATINGGTSTIALATREMAYLPFLNSLSMFPVQLIEGNVQRFYFSTGKLPS